MSGPSGQGRQWTGVIPRKLTGPGDAPSPYPSFFGRYTALVLYACMIVELEDNKCTFCFRIHGIIMDSLPGRDYIGLHWTDRYLPGRLHSAIAGLPWWDTQFPWPSLYILTGVALGDMCWVCAVPCGLSLLPSYSLHLYLMHICPVYFQAGLLV